MKKQYYTLIICAFLFCGANALAQRGNTKESPIFAGNFSRTFTCPNTMNTQDFTDNYTNPVKSAQANDVFYKFTLLNTMEITISHCGSALSDTYLFLLDASGNLIDYNDDTETSVSGCSSGRLAYLKKNLYAGTYYVVSEGYNQNGEIKTTISGIASEFNYTEFPDTQSSSTESVGTVSGVFDVSPTGAATYTIPIKVPTGVNGMQPNIAITYNSQAGNGVVGWGANISGISAITRMPKSMYYDGMAKGITHDNSDALMLNGQRLILVSGTAGADGAVYNTENDPFTTITFKRDFLESYFEVVTKDGMKYTYGYTSNSRQTYSSKVNAWYLNEVVDLFSNYMSYVYTNNGNFIYLSSILYGDNKMDGNAPNHTITFSYETRTDVIPFKLESTSGSMNWRLKTITTKTESSVFRKYTLGYRNNDQFSRLGSITEENSAGEKLPTTYLNWDYLPSFSPTAQNISVDDWNMRRVISGDFNGDGLDDIITIYTESAPDILNSGSVQFASLYNSGKDVYFSQGPYLQLGLVIEGYDDVQYSDAGYNAVDFDGDGINELMIPHYSFGLNSNDKASVRFSFYNCVQGSLKKEYVYSVQNSKEMPLFASADFNNDGKTGDIIFIERTGANGSYPGQIFTYNGSSFTSYAINLSLPQKPEKLFAADFNNDGMTDIMAVYSTGYTIFWNNSNGISASTFSNSNKTTGTNIKNNKMIYPGDFNGDGLIDFITIETNNNVLNLFLNNGNGVFSLQSNPITLSELNTTAENRTIPDNAFKCFAYDFDFDGKTDIVLTVPVKEVSLRPYPVQNGSQIVIIYTSFTTTTTHTYWLNSTGTGFTKKQHSESALDMTKYFTLGNFNGDGKPELMNYSYNCYTGYSTGKWQIYKNSSLTHNSGMLTSINDGLNITNINYRHLTDDDLYTKGNSSTYPLVDIKSALPVVKTVIADNGYTTTNYTYEEARAHLQGKGFLGFKKIMADNTTLGVKTETGVTSLHSTFFVPTETYTKTTTDSKTVQTTVKYTYVDKLNKKYFVYPNTKIEADIYGNNNTTTYQYEPTNGNITQEKTTFGSSTNYRQTDYANYFQAGGTRPNKPQLITVTQKHSDDNNSFVNKTYFTYNAARGYSTKKTENYQQTGLELTTDDIYYDDYGNLTSYKVSVGNISSITYHIGYDATKRFVDVKTTEPATSRMYYTYDIWGNMLTEKDKTNSSNILTTTHTYNDWGQRISTTLPTGQKSTYTRGWGIYDTWKYFTVTQGTGIPWKKTWYDTRGHVTKTETIGAKDMKISTTNTYNGKGQLTKTENKQGSLTLTDSYEYDALGRMSKETKGSGQVINYAYANRQATTTTNSRTYSKTFDVWGNVKTATDPGGTVTYIYKSNGKPKTITSAGSTTTMEYDAIGNQTKLIDPNAGTTTYKYNMLGQLQKQVNARGHMTENLYDEFNRQTSRFDYIDGLYEIETEYAYGTSGNNNQRLKEIEKGNMSIKYTYDSYGDLYSEERLIDKVRIYYVQYQRDSQTKKTAPYFYSPDNGAGNFYNKSVYDGYGNLLKREATIHTPALTPTTATVWELTGNTGTQTTANIANAAMTLTKSYDSKGFPSTQKTAKGSTNILNMGYTFSPTTGNLSQRTGMNGTETFGYDNLDRLTGISTISNYVGYLPNGNIDTKYNLGKYTYENSQPHAVKGIENTSNLVSKETQQITCTPFNKVETITEKVGNDNYKLEIIYGPDQQRWKSVLKKNGLTIKTTIFAPDYERVTYENGTTKHFYYIYANDGLAAIGINEDGQPGKIYYAHKDHLGSIVKLTDKDGNAVFSATYDAWGKQTITTNTINFHRGYTGHEHLPEFGLINMNGRMYDPILGRMLSPDTYVHDPYFSQSYNRYSYCANNPLKYIDLSGLDYYSTNNPYQIVNFTGLAASSLYSTTPLYYNFNYGWDYSLTVPNTAYDLTFNTATNLYYQSYTTFANNEVQVIGTSGYANIIPMYNNNPLAGISNNIDISTNINQVVTSTQTMINVGNTISQQVEALNYKAFNQSASGSYANYVGTAATGVGAMTNAAYVSLTKSGNFLINMQAESNALGLGLDYTKEIGSVAKYAKWSRTLGAFSTTISVGITEGQYWNQEISETRRWIEHTSTAISMIPVYGVGWAIGWELGKYYGPSTWFK